MAELDTSQKGGHGKKGGKRSKKMSTRIDLTPMVDLGFLLVTFFMLTTTFSKPQTMEINMPVKDEAAPEEGMAVKSSKALTILMDKDNILYYYKGIEDPILEKSEYYEKNQSENIRKILLAEHARVEDLMVLIKATEGATYKNVVDVLDEMNIVGISRYALVEITDFDKDLITKQGEGKAG